MHSQPPCCVGSHGRSCRSISYGGFRCGQRATGISTGNALRVTRASTSIVVVTRGTLSHSSSFDVHTYVGILPRQERTLFDVLPIYSSPQNPQAQQAKFGRARQRDDYVQSERGVGTLPTRPPGLGTRVLGQAKLRTFYCRRLSPP